MPKVAKAPSTQELINQFTSSLRRTSANPTIFGYKAQPHQIPFHSSTKVGRLFLGGNRAGKTVAGAAEMVMWLTGKHPYQQLKFKPPIRCRAIGVDFDNGIDKIVKPEIARWMPPSELINGSWEESYSKSARTLTLANGSTLEFMSYDQDIDKFAGTSRHLVWFDEEPPEEIYNENLLRLADVGGHWMLTMTPLIDMSWTLDRLYEKGMNGDNPNLDVFRVNTLDNAYINSAVLEILTEGLSDEEATARKEGRYFSYSGAIYNDVLGACLIDPILPHSIEDPVDTPAWNELKKKGKWGHFGMLDHGFTNPTAFLLGAYDEHGRIIIYREYYKSKLIVKEHAKNIKEIIANLGIDVEYIVADPSTRNTDPITGFSIQTEYAENGVYLSLANNDVSTGINRVYSRLKNKQIYITRDCEKLIWEMQRYRWAKFANKKVESKNNVKEVPMKKDDHAVDALRYGVTSRPMLSGEVDTASAVVFNGSTAITENKPLRDEELYESTRKEQTYYDPILGDEW